MDRQKRLSLVQFWLVVDGLRNPLEDDIDEDEEEPTTSSKWTESDRNDIAQVYEAYFSKPELHIQETAKNDVRTFLKAGSKATPRQYHKARGAILRTQTAVLDVMQNADLVSFKISDLYYKYLASDDLASSVTASRVSSASTTMVRSMSQVKIHAPPNEYENSMASSRHSFDERRTGYDTWDDGRMSSSIQNLEQQFPQISFPTERKGTPDNKVVEAVEAALNDIVEEKPILDEGILFLQPSPVNLSPDSPRSSIDESNGSGTIRVASRDSLFGNTLSTSLFGITSSTSSSKKEKGKDTPPSIASLGLINPYARGEVFSDDELFPDENPMPDSEYDHDEESLHNGNKNPVEDEIHEADPGDLGLAEAIQALNYDVEKLSTQEVVVDSLTRKAELTNNTTELRILRKSKASLQREIRRKELQRQQYIIQESENSLFGRSSTSINRTIVGKENGKEYALCKTHLPINIPLSILTNGRRHRSPPRRRRTHACRSVDRPPPL